MMVNEPVASRSRSAVAWVGVACGLALLPYLALAAFAHPIADDFTYAFDTRRDGWWAAYLAQYRSWNGRYASNVFELANPMAWGGLGLYRLVAAAMIVGTAMALYAFIRALTRGAWTRGQALTGALVLAALFAAVVPSPSESFYWFTSTVTYQLSSILVVLHAALMIRFVSGQFRDRLTGAAAVLLVPAVVGMNEVVMLLMVVSYGLLLLASILDGRRRIAVIAAATLVVALASGAVVWLAPGNSVRSAMYPGRHAVVRSIALTAAQTLRFGATWATSGSLLLTTVLFLPAAVVIARDAAAFRAISPVRVGALAAGLALIIPIAVFPAYWSTGVLGQHRTISVAFLVFLLLWFTLLIALYAVGALPEPAGLIVDRRVRMVTGVLLIAALAMTGNGYRVAGDWAARTPLTFDREMSSRYSALRACAAAPQQVCPIAPLTARPDAFYVVDVSTDPDDWVNNAYRYYFGTGAVIAQAPR